MSETRRIHGRVLVNDRYTLCGITIVRGVRVTSNPGQVTCAHCAKSPAWQRQAAFVTLGALAA